MTDEELKILAYDLAARVPHEVKCQFTLKYGDNGHKEGVYIATINEFGGNNWLEVEYNDTSGASGRPWLRDWSCSLEDIKPYLRPMSSMTEEDRKEFEFMMKDYSVLFLRVCVRMTYDFNCVDVINDLVRKYKESKKIQDTVKDIDRRFRLHTFEYGIDEAAAKYLSRVMAAIYGVLVKFNKSLCESKHFSNIESYRKIFYNNCFENR